MKFSPTRSIASRLLIVNGIVLAGFVVLTAIAVSWSVHTRAETARFDRLQGMIYGILGATDLSTDSTGRTELVVNESALPERRLGQSLTGIYAELVGNDGRAMWRSASSVVRQPETRPTPIGEWLFDSLPGEGNLPGVDSLQLQSVWVLDSGEELPFIVHVVDEGQSLGRELARFDRTLWATLAGVALILLAVQTVLLKKGLAPLERIGKQVDAVERGSRDALDTDLPTELAPLADGLNALLASERGRRTRYRNLLDDLAHSLKTPLTILGNIADSALIEPQGIDAAAEESPRSESPPPARAASTGSTRADAVSTSLQQQADVAATLREQTMRMRASIERSLQRATRQGTVVLAAPLEVRPVLDSLTRSLAKLFSHREISFEIDVPDDFIVRISDVDLHEILGNVLENACKYGASRIRINGTASRRTLLVDDDGPGFPVDPEALLARGARADLRQDGQGLGLAASQELLASHGGQLSLATSPEGGARVVLAFDVATAASRTEPSTTDST